MARRVLEHAQKSSALDFSSLSDFIRKTSNPNYNRPSPLLDTSAPRVTVWSVNRGARGSGRPDGTQNNPSCVHDFVRFVKPVRRSCGATLGDGSVVQIRADQLPDALVLSPDVGPQRRQRAM